jgi:hypothetical protein
LVGLAALPTSGASFLALVFFGTAVVVDGDEGVDVDFLLALFGRGAPASRMVSSGSTTILAFFLPVCPAAASASFFGGRPLLFAVISDMLKIDEQLYHILRTFKKKRYIDREQNRKQRVCFDANRPSSPARSI